MIRKAIDVRWFDFNGVKNIKISRIRSDSKKDDNYYYH